MEALRKLIEEEIEKARREADSVKHHPSDYLREEVKGYYRGVSTLGSKILRHLDQS